MSPTIAVIQFKIKHLDRADNFSWIEVFIQDAKAKDAQVIVFPEDCITGSIFGVKSRLDQDASVRKTFQTLAQKHTIDIVTGSVMEHTPEGDFNTSYYIDATGTVLGEYRKNHLYGSENDFLNPGTEIAVFDTKYGRAGIIICWDILFPEIFARMKKAGVEIVYCPSYWYREIAGDALQIDPLTEEKRIDMACLARAKEYGITFVYCNSAGEIQYEDGSMDTCIGHSQIVVPGRGVVAKLEHNQEMMITSPSLTVL